MTYKTLYTEEYRLYNMNPTLSEDEIMYSTVVGSSFSTSGSSCMFHTYLYFVNGTKREK